jgi:hypothetical protein
MKIGFSFQSTCSDRLHILSTLRDPWPHSDSEKPACLRNMVYGKSSPSLRMRPGWIIILPQSLLNPARHTPTFENVDVEFERCLVRVRVTVQRKVHRCTLFTWQHYYRVKVATSLCHIPFLCLSFSCHSKPFPNLTIAGLACSPTHG